jgi:UDP-glucose 4-epimerase
VHDKNILVTGGSGYIGSHAVVQLISAGYKVMILDNLSNSNRIAIERIERITNNSVDFIFQDLRDLDGLRKQISNLKIDSVIHFAGLKAVGESAEKPILYYENNICGTLNLIRVINEMGVNKLIFSSSATVYGDPGYAKCSEETPLAPQSVYGQTKYFIEEIIKSYQKANSDFKYGILRYFNPIGAHMSGLIGEDPNGIPNNLVPYISQVAIGKRPKLQIWGSDYPTADGTGRRDYIHVEDLVAGHLAALEHLDSGDASFTVNLGTGNSYSVLEMIKAFEEVSGKKIPYEFAERRVGDVAENYADPTLAKKLLSWSAKLDLRRMCEDTWRWQKNNPEGYN